MRSLHPGEPPRLLQRHRGGVAYRENLVVFLCSYNTVVYLDLCKHVKFSPVASNKVKGRNSVLLSVMPLVNYSDQRTWTVLFYLSQFLSYSLFQRPAISPKYLLQHSISQKLRNTGIEYSSSSDQ